MRFVAFVLAVVCGGSLAGNVCAQSIKIDPPNIQVVGIGGQSADAKSDLLAVRAGTTFRIDVGKVKWRSAATGNPLSFSISPSQFTASTPAAVTVTLGNQFVGKVHDTLEIPIVLLEGEDGAWKTGETKIVPLDVTGSRPCTSTNGQCDEPLGALCTLSNSSSYWSIKADDYDLKASNAISAHIAKHFSAYLQYELPVSSLWEPLGITGPISSCCPCATATPPACASPIEYARWNSKSTVANVEWGGTLPAFKSTDPNNLVEVEIEIPSKISDAIAHVSGSFIEYIFNNANKAPVATVKDLTTGKVVMSGRIACYNLSVSDGVIRFIDRKILPIRIQSK